MKPFQIHIAAEDETRDAIARYEAAQGGLGRRFRFAMSDAIERIRTHPQLYPVENANGDRFCRIKRFSYFLVYVDFPDRVWVSALVHTRRGSQYWSARRPNDV